MSGFPSVKIRYKYLKRQRLNGFEMLWICDEQAVNERHRTRVIFTMGCGPSAWQKSHDLMTNNRTSIGKMAP